MDKPAIYKPTFITSTGFKANWGTVSSATKYYLDVATDLSFTNLLAGYSALEVAGNSANVAGLTAHGHYYYRVRASNADDSDLSDLSYYMEVVTGFSVGSVTVEFGNLLTDLFNVQAIVVEVSTNFNFQAIVRDKDGNRLNSAKCLMVQVGWANIGEFDPVNDADPTTPSEGYFYTISQAGENDITGEVEEFTPVDLLVYLNGVWQIKKRRHVYSDAGGVANLFVDYSVDNMLCVTKAGFQDECQILNYVSGEHQYDVMMYPVVSVVTTSKGYAVNTQPAKRDSRHFS